MKTLLKKIRMGAVILATVGIVSPHAAWAGGSKTGHVASHSPSPTRPSASGGAAGKVKFNEFTVKKTTDKASPNLLKNCVSGTHYKEAIIHVRKAGGDPKSAGKPYLQFKFDTVFTTKIGSSGPGEKGPKESISLPYTKVIDEYKSQ